MVEEALYLKMRNPADMLAVHYLAESGQIKGEFVQETEPPWDVWWKLAAGVPGPALAQVFRSDADTIEETQREDGQEPRLWTLATPTAEVKKAGWLDLFKTFVLRREETRRLSDLIVLRTSDKKLFLEAVRRHFLLQQGLMDFAVFNPGTPFWLLRIRNPSVWALDTFLEKDADGVELYNQVHGSEGLFVEAGWSLNDPANGVRLNHFRFMEKNCVFIRGAGNLDHLNPNWVHAPSIIDISCPSPSILQPEEKEKIQIKPALRDTEEKAIHGLWKVEDVGRFQAILANESMARFAGFSAWFGKDRVMWLLSGNERTDRGIASLFSDTFPAFVKIEKNIFIPAGKVLSPRLPEERLKQIFRAGREDFLCLDMESGELRATQLSRADLKNIDYFVTFQAENTLKGFENYQSQWVFDFPEVKKK